MKKVICTRKDVSHNEREDLSFTMALSAVLWFVLMLVLIFV